MILTLSDGSSSFARSRGERRFLHPMRLVLSSEVQDLGKLSVLAVLHMADYEWRFWDSPEDMMV